METQTYNYKVVRQFAIMTVIWGIIGMFVGVYAAAELRWPALNMSDIAPWFHFGRIRPLHTNAVIFAFGGCGLICHVLLCGAANLQCTAVWWQLAARVHILGAGNW